MAKKLSVEEKKWQAQSDARTMAAYQEIMNSASRRNAAIKAAKEEASRLQKQADAMKYACGGKLRK